MIVLTTLSLPGLSQLTDSTTVWEIDGNICMYPEKAALLVNSYDTLQKLKVRHKLIESTLSECRTLVTLKTKAIESLIKEKIQLQSKIQIINDRLINKDNNIDIFKFEVKSYKSDIIIANKKIKAQDVKIKVISVISGVAIVALIVTVILTSI